MNKLPEYCEELTESQQLAAQHTSALERYIEDCLKNVTSDIIQKKSMTYILTK